MRLLFKIKTIIHILKTTLKPKYATILAENTLNKLGKNVTFSSDYSVYNCDFEGNNSLYGVGRISNSSLGYMSYCQTNSIISNAKIGRYCSIGPGVMIALGEHPINFLSTHQFFYSNYNNFSNRKNNAIVFNEHRKVSIGNDVWIGANCYIKDGVTIGNGAIIATGSVVVANVEAYSIMGGVPAKLIKYRFDKEIIALIVESEWWNLSQNTLNKVADHFMYPLNNENAKEFINEIKKHKNNEYLQ